MIGEVRRRGRRPERAKPQKEVVQPARRLKANSQKISKRTAGQTVIDQRPGPVEHSKDVTSKGEVVGPAKGNFG